MTGKLTDNYNVILANIGIGLLTNSYSTYVIAGNPFTWADESEPPEVLNTDADITACRSALIVGVKIDTDDIVPVVNRNTWTTDIVYDQYDPTKDLESLIYYIINSNRDVYKCLFNNNAAQSNVEPTAKTTSPFALADGYIWKYLYTISEADETKFGSASYIVLTPNSSITSAAIAGTIDAYEMVSSNTGFYSAETGTITGILSTTQFKIDNSANAASNTFGGSAIYISDGTGAGSIRSIRNSSANSSGKYVTTASDITLDLTSEYYISPAVTIDGDGADATAIAIVNNSIVEKVLTVGRGVGYTAANVTISINPAFGISAQARPLISNLTGHGANVNIELISKKLAISSTFTPGIHTDLPSGIDYRQLAVIMAPWSPSLVLANAETVSFATKLTTNGSFSSGDNVVGETSGAKGTVYTANSTVTKVVGVSGTFANGEFLTCNSTNETSQITHVAERDVDKNSGQVVYYSNFEPINRSNTSSENVRLVIDFQG